MTMITSWVGGCAGEIDRVEDEVEGGDSAVNIDGVVLGCHIPSSFSTLASLCCKNVVLNLNLLEFLK